MKTRTSVTLALFVALLPASRAVAGENGGSAYVHGAEGWLTGVMPPPGNYLLSYTNYYHANRLNDENGKNEVPNFQLDVASQTLRYVHVTKTRIAGGSLAFQVIVPVVDLHVRAGQQSDHQTGIGDITVTPLILGWNEGKWHYGFALGAVLPTGAYRRGALANIGRNYLTFEPVVAITDLDPEGPEVSVKLIYHATGRNDATHYRSGNEMHADFAAGWSFRNIVAGVSGYYSRQIEDDRQRGKVIGGGNRGEVFALGPSMKWQLGKVPLMVSWQHELRSRSKPQGDKLWLKVVLPLGGS